MTEEALKRVLRLLREGRLTEEQAESMIEAIRSRGQPGAGEEQAVFHEDDGEASGSSDKETRHTRRARRGRRRRTYSRRGKYGHVQVDVDLGDTVADAISGGLHAASSAIKQAGRTGPVFWLNESNVSTLSRLEDPGGADFKCEDNNITVSQLRDVLLSSSSFCDNEVNASGIKGLEARSSDFCGNELHGSSIKHLTLEEGKVSNCQLNGSQISNATVRKGKLHDCTFNGAQFRDLNIDDAGVADSDFNGANVSSLVVSDHAEVGNLCLNGVKCRDMTIEGGRLVNVRISGLRLDAFHLGACQLNDVTFRNETPRGYAEPRRHGRPLVRDTKLESVTADNVAFIRCRFDGTVMRNCHLKDMTFRDVDFSDMTIESADAISGLAESTAAEEGER